MTTLAPAPALVHPFPLYPPPEWFAEMPSWFTIGDKVSFQTEGPDAGRVAATIAPRDQCILDGTDQCWTAPFSPTNYAAAHQGDALCADGTMLKTANLCAGVNHARLSASFREVAKRAENTGTQIARVRYYDLESHIIALGALWPDVTELQLAIARAAGLSGDWRWRPELGAYDMAESIFVNTPGFPLIRKYARAASLGEYVHDPDGEYPPVFIGGLGGIGTLEPEPDFETDDACPHCGAPPDLAQRLEDVEGAIAQLAAR